MDDGEVILIAPDTKNQDGSQTYFILDPCPSEDCIDDPPGIELIDLTKEYQVENTGAIAVVSTNSTGAIEITLKKPEDIEEMDTNSQSGINKTSGMLASSSSDVSVIEMINDDDTNRPVKDEEEDVDVEEISIHDISIESSVIEQKSEPESVDFCEGREDLQPNQNDQDDDIEEGTLYIDDAKYTELQEELAQDGLHDLNNLNSVIQQVEGGDEEKCNTPPVEPKEIQTNALNEGDDDDIEILEYVENKNEKIISLSFDVISGPTAKRVSNKNEIVQEAFIHGQLIEIPSSKQPEVEANMYKEFTESTNTALTLLELAGSPGAPLINKEIKGNKEGQNSGQESDKTTSEEIAPEHEEPTLATLQPVQLDPPVSNLPILENANSKSAATSVVIDTAPKAKTDVPSTPKPPKIRLTPEELVQRLKDGDTPRQLLGKESGIRGREALYMSPLVTRAEIAQEFMDRQLQKTPYTEPSGGDYIFAMKLAHRLATKIVAPEAAVPQPEEMKSETKDESVTIQPQNILRALESDSISKTNTENDNCPKKSYAISDKIELLKILEDDPEDVPSSDVSQIILEQKVKSDRKKSQHAPLIKMHPELEKELALKQLQDFNQKGVRNKKKVSFTPDLKKIKLEKGHEHNNNFNSVQKQTNGTKKRVGEILGKHSKRVKKEEVKAVTADPSLITETLTVEGQTLIDDPSTKDGKSIKQYSNKRLSRSSETPPRLLPMDIVLNGIDNLPEVKEESSQKNKIFKATNPRKRKEELQEKRQKHFTNVFQRNKPQKKRGRPPKKKAYPSNDELNKEFLLKASLQSNNSVNENHQDSSNQETSLTDKEEKPVKTKKMREIERLLGDEGAINMLYSVEQKRASGGESKRGMLPSYRRKKKDLILKTKLVKSAVLRLTTNPPLTSGRISLRGQAPKEGESEESDKSSLRKMSVDSHDSHHSLSSPPPEPFPFPAKIVPAEASRIIRRHSSSSNYSSRSNSPRRLSADAERINILSPEVNSSELEQSVPSVAGNSKQKQIKLPQQTSAESLKKLHDKSERLLTDKSKEHLHKDHIPQPKLPPSVKNKSKLPVKIESPKLRGRPRKMFTNDESKGSTELNSSLAAALEDFAKENKSGGKNIPADTPKKLTSPVPNSKTVYRKSTDTTRTRTPKPSKVYKELTLGRHGQVVEIALTPVSTKLHNAFNTNVLQELTSVLSGLSKDDNCHVVLITSQGTVFCQGVDFPALIKPTMDQRRVAALEMAVAIKEFVKSIAMLARPVVMAVHAPAVGLGVTMLPLCDMVVATEDATFHTPYTRLGHVPEGAASLTFPSLLGPSVTSELLFACQKFSASEARQAGLVTRVLPTEKFHEEVLSIAKAMASQSAQAMNATKVLLRHGLLTGLETTLVSETHLLTKHWVSAECQENFTSALEKEEYVLATPPTPLTLTPSPTTTGTNAHSEVEVGPK